MENSEGATKLLKTKYDLHKSPEVVSAAKRTEGRTGEKVPQDPESRIENYLERFAEITDRTDPEKRERGVNALKRVLFNKFITKFEDVPQSYWDSQDRILRERGQAGDWSRYSDEQKLEERKGQIEGVLDDQRSSLEQWIDYLSSSDSSYIPDPIKYWVFRNVTGLQEYDKEKHEFPKRSKGTVNMFPDINHEALAYVIDAVIKKQTGKPIDFAQFQYDLTDEAKQQFTTYLKGENFAKLYSWAHEQIQPIPQHLLPVTDGSWVTYQKGTDSSRLIHSIRGRGTGWCTAGENTAKSQLQGGDFHVYYSKDDESNPTIPRIAIRMEQDRIAEVRGIASKQNLDPYMGDVLTQKLDEFPDKDQYLKKEADMKLLTALEQKTTTGQPLTKDDLTFLYEIDASIEGFGYQADPRVAELRAARNLGEDMLVVFECTQDQVARCQEDVRENTKAYVGPLFPGIFDRLQLRENIYTSFPEGKIRFQDVMIGGKTAHQLEDELVRGQFPISQFARDLLRSKEFVTSKDLQNVRTVRLKVRDLGLGGSPTTDQVFARAKELELELCPAEVGPHLRLNYLNQPMNESFSIAVKSISDSYGYPRVFLLGRDADGLWLNDRWMGPFRRWHPEHGLVFLLSK